MTSLSRAYLFAIDYSQAYEGFTVAVVSKDFWEENHFMADESIKEPLLAEYFAEETDGCFSPKNPNMTEKEAVELLTSLGMEYSENFSEFLDWCNDSED